MVELDWRVETHAGIALVELVVRNPAATARRFRVANCLDGPVWPPRREGVPAAGWDDGGFESVVAPEDRRVLGYASPAPESASDSASDTESESVSEPTSGSESASEPPAELVWTERAGASETGYERGRDSDAFAADATPDGVVRALGDPRPPADAVPSVRPDAEGKSPTRESAESTSDSTEPIPGAVESWLSAVEERAERRSDPPPASRPTAVEPTPEDRAALRAVARRIGRLRGDDSEPSRSTSPSSPRSDDSEPRRSP